MTESIRIPTRTVADWQTQGFAFKQAPGDTGSTEVTFQGKQFRCFLRGRIGTTGELLTSLHDEVVLRDNLVVEGQYAPHDEFPWFLITDESWELLEAARSRRVHAMNEAERALGDFSDALLDPENYNG